MAEATGKDTNFNFTSMDWDAYVKYRPVYPSKLYSTIYAYHDSHGKYDSAVDVGAGIGVVSAELVKKFKHVILTDPIEQYVDQAKAHFGDKVSYLQTKVENLTVEPADLVTAAECLHWTDMDLAVPQMASALKSGGTLAAFSYGVQPILRSLDGKTDIDGIRTIFYDIFAAMCHQYETQIEKASESTSAANFNARLDNMYFPAHTWRDVRRMYSNKTYTMLFERWPQYPSRVSEGEKLEDLEDEYLSHEADYDYLEGYMVNWIPAIKPKEFAKDELEKLKKIMDGGKVRIIWPFVMVLATRR